MTLLAIENYPYYMKISCLNKSFLLVILIALNIFAQEPKGKQKTYSTEDLKVLNNQGKYIELFEHLYDVIPSKRKTTWQTIFQQAVSNYIKKTTFSDQEIEVLYRLSINPDVSSKVLKKSLSDKLADEIVKGLENPKTRNQSQLVLKKFLEQENFHFTKSFNIGEKLYKLGLEQSPYEFTWQLISSALNSNVSEMYCDQAVAIELLKEKINFNQTSKDENSFEVLGQINEQCWEKFTASLYKNIDFKQDDKRGLYKLLLSSGLKDQDKHYLGVMYLLMSRKDKELTNISWNSLDHLKDHPDKRTKILKEISSLDPLPDLSFTGKDQATLSFINQLNNSFPEYFNHYLKTCYQYISGIKKFNMGNPTINCRELISKLNKAQIDENIYAKEIKKIFSPHL